jgi:NodT family efflux transporter outer membrane factor (OMF) lipoprotein
MRKYISIIILAGLLSSCNVYQKFSTPKLDKEQWLSKEIETKDTSNFELPAWNQYFNDTLLIELIQEGLQNNTDLKIATKNIEKYEALLRSSKLQMLPSLVINPNAQLSDVNSSNVQKNYHLPVSMSWEVGATGKVHNNKRKSQAKYQEGLEAVKYVKTQLIANIANSYYTLIMLDKQLEMTNESAKNMKKNVEVLSYLRDSGTQNEAAVNQALADYKLALISVKDLEKSIQLTENALSVILYRIPGKIKRSNLIDEPIVANLQDGISLKLVSNRPDVKQKELQLAQFYYDVNIARGAFYPSITLSGNMGWQANGSPIIDPSNFIINALGSLSQPIFKNGVNRANLKVAKVSYEQALLQYQQTLLQSGNEVNDALIQYTSAKGKLIIRDEQIDALKLAIKNTELLMKAGKNNCLAVLTAQNSFLSANILKTSEWFECVQAKINLYKSLGGYRNN